MNSPRLHPRAIRSLAGSFLVLSLSGCATDGVAPTPPTAASASGTVAAVPAEPRAGETFEISQLDQKPVPRFQARPVYPAALREKKVSGEAVVDFIVDTNGDVQNAFALRNTHPAFGEAAVAAVAKWKFKPGRKAGRDVNTHMQVPIVFTLNEK